MRKSKLSVSIISTNLNQYTREAAARISSTFLSCWDTYHATHPELFTPEAVLFR